MNTIQRFFWLHLLIAVSAISASYAMSGLGLVAAIFVFFGAAWAAARQRNAQGIAGIVLTLFLVAGGLGALLGMPGWLMLVMTVAALGAWDLDHFLQRLSGIKHVDYSTGIGRAHLRRLVVVEAIGLVAGLLALLMRTQIPFWWEALLVLLAVIGLRVLAAFVRRESES